MNKLTNQSNSTQDTATMHICDHCGGPFPALNGRNEREWRKHANRRCSRVSALKAKAQQQ